MVGWLEKLIDKCWVIDWLNKPMNRCWLTRDGWLDGHKFR